MDIYLHVGHPKTGSSYLQSSFALSRKALEESGILYPESPSDDDAKHGFITSGNWTPTTNCSEQLIGSHRGILYSSEGMFLNPEEIKNICASNPQRVKILLFIRDPLDHAISLYMQHVKRGGHTEPDAHNSLERYQTLGKVKRFLGEFADITSSITVVNYSKNRNNLLGIAEEWLGVRADTLIPPPIGNINRSLTPSEAYIQIALNKLIGSSGQYFADKVCNQLPELGSDDGWIYTSSETVKRFLATHERAVSELNLVLPQDQSYRLPKYEEIADRIKGPLTPTSFDLNDQQVRCLVQSIAQLDSQWKLQLAVSALTKGGEEQRAGNKDMAKNYLSRAKNYLQMVQSGGYPPEVADYVQNVEQMVFNLEKNL